MTWNYRVIRTQVAIDGEAFYEYAIHECFYKTKEDKIPNSWTKNAITPGGTTIDALAGELVLMAAATRKPILEEKDGKLVEVI